MLQAKPPTKPRYVNAASRSIEHVLNTDTGRGECGARTPLIRGDGDRTKAGQLTIRPSRCNRPPTLCRVHLEAHKRLSGIRGAQPRDCFRSTRYRPRSRFGAVHLSRSDPGNVDESTLRNVLEEDTVCFEAIAGLSSTNPAKRL